MELRPSVTGGMLEVSISATAYIIEKDIVGTSPNHLSVYRFKTECLFPLSYSPVLCKAPVKEFTRLYYLKVPHMI